MTLGEKFLLHQVHPGKLATDVAASIASLILLWQHHLWLGLAVHFIPPPVGSAAVIYFADLERLQSSALGRYLTRYMSPAAQAARLAGDFITVVAAWYQSLLGILLGLAIVGAAWSYGLLMRRMR